MLIQPQTTRQHGVSLIEVLVSVLIFSLGLVGIASLLVMATGANHGAYLRTQATYLAQNMANRMSANPIALWNGDYNDGSYPVSGGPDCTSSPCSPAQIAAFDKTRWSNQLRAFLPNPQATINCDTSNTGFAVDASDLVNRPPYGGSCSMTITWSDRGVGDETNRDAQDQTFAWTFQP